MVPSHSFHIVETQGLIEVAVTTYPLIAAEEGEVVFLEKGNSSAKDVKKVPTVVISGQLCADFRV